MFTRLANKRTLQWQARRRLKILVIMAPAVAAMDSEDVRHVRVDAIIILAAPPRANYANDAAGRNDSRLYQWGEQYLKQISVVGENGIYYRYRGAVRFVHTQ